MGLETAAIIGLATAAASLAGTVIPAVINKPKTPKPPTLLADPNATNKALAESEQQQRRQAAAARGRSSTILTSPLGAEEDTSTSASLLGS